MISMNIVKVALLRSSSYGQSSLFTLGRALITTSERLKREDVRNIEYDSAFSEWKVLVRGEDWKNHSMEKEGAKRYKMQSLPESTSCPGAYELGIAKSCEIDHAVPVYVGHAHNVRTRLQHYGRDGAHLENCGFSDKNFHNCSRDCYLKVGGLFSQIFSREDLSIVYRFATMRSKKDAEKTEHRLLQLYDYAWNKRRNGERRPGDIHRRLDCYTNQTQFSPPCTMFRYFHHKLVGDKIRTFHLFWYN